jgi:Flp pilus assembly pilin Flp
VKQKLRPSDLGASAIEYVLLAAVGSVLLIAGITLFGEFLVQTYSDSCTSVTAELAAEADSFDADNCAL